MEQSYKKSQICKPKPLRLYGAKGSSVTLTKSMSDQTSQLSKAREESELFFTPQLKSDSNHASCEEKLAGLCQLEKLVSLKDDECFSLQEKMLAEKELCMRSTSLSNFFYINPESEQKLRRCTFPFMNKAVSAPERPSNPMVRDNTFSFDTEKACVAGQLSMLSDRTPCQAFDKEPPTTCVPN
jgi:hypothetical protein